MLVVLNKNAAKKDIKNILQRIAAMGLRAEEIPGSTRTAIGILGNTGYVDADALTQMAGVKEVIHVTKPYKLVSREWKNSDTVINVDGVKIGGKNFTIMAGPCSVESEQQLMKTAEAVKRAGAQILRGGAFKPRTTPYSFQGLGLKGLKILQKAKLKFGLPIITELLHVQHLDLVAQYTDIIQIGARNMQNFEMLIAVGKLKKPVMLKRGMSARMEEFLLAAEYILNAGNPNVILCERGIRTFETATRNTLDLNIAALIKELSHLPIIVDPSHGTGRYSLVAPLSLAALAIGNHGLMIEVHPEPEKALSDGDQSLNFKNFSALMKKIHSLTKYF
ncbi:3-deoxy-7-phosphoheptulonate synthase [Candidatus Peregrinibacteria bacterium]|nr:3-deoxy-7-phosphoheptulonate synthase [Candidatus Peregrinibacteria bacterium]